MGQRKARSGGLGERFVRGAERRGARGQVSSPWGGEEGCGAGEGGWGGLGCGVGFGGWSPVMRDAHEWGTQDVLGGRDPPVI